jgi:hypothetical protein
VYNWDVHQRRKQRALKPEAAATAVAWEWWQSREKSSWSAPLVNRV